MGVANFSPAAQTIGTGLVSEQAARRQALAPPVVDMSRAPSVDPFTAFAYWAHFYVRYYAFGPKHGHYGPRFGLRFLKWLERRIEKQSKRTGEIQVRPVPRIGVEDLPAEEFQRVYLKSNTPVVIEGMASDWEAVRTWTPDWFKTQYGDNVIPVRMDTDRLTSLGLTDMKFGDFIDSIHKGEKHMGGNMEDIFNNNPELRQALDIATLTRYGVSNKRAKIGSTQLFISGPGTRSGFHCTNGINLFVQIYGNKEWSFVSPKHSKWMYPITRKDMFYAATIFDWKKPFEEIEKEGWPLYKYVPKFQTLLKPGDVLFSPQWWWHAVNTPNITIAVATRSMNQFTIGNKVFSFIWLTSKEFRELVYHLMKTGWGSDRSSGARRAFEEGWVNKVMH